MKKTSVPFGVNVKRFINLGHHPQFDETAGTSKFLKIFPGCYNYKGSKITSKVPSPKTDLEVEKFSKQFGHQGNHIIEEKKWLDSVNGPAWHDIPQSFHGRNIIFSKAERYPVEKFKSFAVPGPGTYGKNHVPHTRLEEKSTTKGFSFSILPTFEHCGCNCRGGNESKPYHLPPNIYSIKSSIDELVFKKTSKRGPYDLFSGERFPDKNKNTGESLLYAKSFHDRNKSRDVWKGKFLRCGKEDPVTSRIILKSSSGCQKNPLDPGPGYYNLFPPPVIQERSPLKKSELETRHSSKPEISPPLGRYNVCFMKKIKGDGFKSVFISKTKRSVPQAPKWSWFE